MPRQSLKKPTVSFQEKVYKVIKGIHKGNILTYREVAEMAGSPRAWRAVGNILNKNKDLKNIPCYRVVRSDGKVGGYRGGQRKKIALIKKDGISVKNSRIIFK